MQFVGCNAHGLEEYIMTLKYMGHAVYFYLVESSNILQRIFKCKYLQVYSQITKEAESLLESTMAYASFIFWGSMHDLDKSTKHPRFDPTGVRTHDL